MNAIAYMRCSGDAQITGDTWDRQESAIAKFASIGAFNIVASFRDEGISGKIELENREGLSACIQYARENNIKTLIVEDATRLARDLIVAEVIIREMQKAGIRVISASGGVDLTAGDDTNPTAKLIRQILSAVAEFDRCVSTMRMKAAKDRIRTRTGRCEGRKPYGSKPGEEATLARMKELFASDLGFQKIADTLNAEGLPSREGKPWRVGSVHRIIARG